MTRVLLTAVVLASAAAAQEPPAGAGPRGTSGEVRDDTVGVATLLAVTDSAQPTVGIAAMHPSLPAGSFVEVTALDTARTIVAMVVGPYHGRGVVGLSPDAAQALGVAQGAIVRVRSATPNSQDQAALRRGEAASARLDAPPALLTALRKKGDITTLPVVARADRAHPARPAPQPARAATNGGYGVQVAAVSSPDRAAALARALGGRVVARTRLYRIQLGPFPNAAAASRARDVIVRQGYRDARVFHSE